ncbi:MAG TPA: methylamine utilization protein [Burkholderiaceae bacterium]|nr:methylamine utilization protein [Burkholderiaceae bacterium]
MIRTGMRALGLMAALWMAAGAAQAGAIVAKVLDKAGKPMSDAVIYAVPIGAPVPAYAAPAQPVQVVQEDMEFKPYVTVVRTGTPVSFVNKDPHEHHIKSFGPAKEFEFKISTGSPPPIVFDRAGNSVVVCYLHGWMRAHVHTVDTPWFAVSGADGLVRIANVPNGDYELRAWHPDTLAPPLVMKLKVSEVTPLQDVKFEHLPRKRRSKPSQTGYQGE